MIPLNTRIPLHVDSNITCCYPTAHKPKITCALWDGSTWQLAILDVVTGVETIAASYPSFTETVRAWRAGSTREEGK
jgi:hypothetical protein